MRDDESKLNHVDLQDNHERHKNQEKQVPCTQLLTVRQVATELGVNETVVRKKIRSGDLKGCNLGNEKRPQYRVRKADLKTFIEERSVIGIEEDDQGYDKGFDANPRYEATIRMGAKYSS